MGRHALPAAPDATVLDRSTTARRVETEPAPVVLPSVDRTSATPVPDAHRAAGDAALMRRPRGRRSALGPAADAAAVQTPVPTGATERVAPVTRTLTSAPQQSRTVPTPVVAAPVESAPTTGAPTVGVQAPAVAHGHARRHRDERTRRAAAARTVVVVPPVAGTVVLSRSAALRAERAVDPRHMRRAATAKRAAILLAPALAVTSSLTLSLPATAAPLDDAGQPVSSSAPYRSQSFTVARDVEVPVVSTDGMTTTTTVVSYPTIVTKWGVTTEQAEQAISAALSSGGPRATIISTALQYMGDPYVEGGASHQGIDCSGLTMVAYAAVGIPLAHYVPTQDDAATTIPASEAKPGDLVVFDDQDHVGIFLGDGLVLQAPHPGDPVDIVPVYPNAHHFARLLPAGQ
ncbi:NlpC/P60 family protein [Curtobacterium sp. UCD-KPL2560]|uniref:C40 family peptidase n=1 Tax=Curtobacterium sp. UCD-KPL2560 TaxID=1885315 RepID=UPI0008256969|nr:NlpC/P60 family protein [Curtobacterium sp. UCD-KPL2560]